MSHKNKKLLFSLNRSHFTWQYFRGSGPGGQHRNKKDTAVRCIHEPSGARGVSTEHKSQLQNKRAAFKRCCESKEMQLWIRIKASDQEPIEDTVDKMMDPKNIKVEVKDNGRWVTDDG